MSSSTRKDIKSGWRATGIENALEKGYDGIDPFSDIDPLVSNSNEIVQDNQHLCTMSSEELQSGMTVTPNRSHQGKSGIFFIP